MKAMNYRKTGPAFLFFVLLLMCIAGAARAETSPSTDATCGKGRTLQCLALGMEAEKEKDFEAALAYYKMACKSHPTTNLRACTPMLAMAGRMGVLDQEAGFLESRCKKEGNVVCYYLGKEYLKVRQMDRAIEHLEPLCRSGFRPPDTRDFGPCFHLGRSYHARKEYKKAKTFYQLDCGDVPERVHPSCESLRNINLVFALTPERTVEVGTAPETGETLFMALCALPTLGVLVWFFGRPGGLWFLKWGGPMLFLGASGGWLFVVERPPVQGIEIILLMLCFTTVTGLAFFSRSAEAL